MRYVGLSFTMLEGEIYVIQGTASTFTYVNQDAHTIAVKGSNDGVLWDDVVQVAPQDSEVKGHSFKFLKCIGAGRLAVSRGCGGIGAPPSEGGGGGDYNFSVKELDLVATAEKVPSQMLITPDVDNTITGSNIAGKITANDQVKGAYFKADSGEIKLTIDRTTPSHSLFVNLENEPTAAFNEGGIPMGQVVFGCAFLNEATFIIAGYTEAPIQILLPPEGLNPLEEVSFIFEKNKIHIKHKGVILETYINPSSLNKYWQIINALELPDNYKTIFDLSDVVSDTRYILPASAKDGDNFHLTSDGELFNKKLLAGDYITVYGNKSNVTVLRLPSDQLPTTKLTLPITYYLQEHASKELKAYYDTELRAVFVFGLFHLSSFPNQSNIVFEIDLSQISLNAPNLNAQDLITYHGNSIQRVGVVFVREEKLLRVRVDPNLFGGTGEAYFLLSNIVLQATL